MTYDYSTGAGTMGSVGYPDLPDPSDQKKVEDILETVGLHPAQLHVQGVLNQAQPVAESSQPAPLIASPTAAQPKAPEAPQVKIPSPGSAMPTLGGGSTAGPLLRSPQQKNAEDSTVAAQNELARLNTTGSGISQIKNPFLRTLARVGDIAGSALFPSVVMNIPGTELHHRELEAEQEHKIAEGEGQQQKLAQAGEAEARANEANAQTDAILHPERAIGKTPEERAFADLQTQTNPDTGKPYTPAEAFTKIKQTEQDVKPDTKDRQLTRYAELRNKQDSGQQLSGDEQNEFGTLQTKFSVGPKSAQQYNDSIVRELGVNPKTAVKTIPADLTVTPTDTDAEAKEKLSRAQALVSGATSQQHIAISVAGQADKGAQSIFVPNDPNDPSKGYTLQYVKPGETIQPGSVSKGGFDAANKSAEADKKAQQDAQKEYDLAQNLANHPSPTNDLALVIRYIGATKPDSLGKLRLNNNEVNLVYGTRSALGDLDALVEKVKNGQSLTPQQRKDMLDTMKILSSSKGDSGGGAGSAGGHVIKVGDKQYRYNGSGDTADMKNYTEIKANGGR